MKQNTVKSAVVIMICAVVLLTASTAVCADKVVVIPLFSAKKLGNVVTVAKSGGDFTDPVAAVNSISTASASNPYLIFIGPGVYTLNSGLIMKEYISVMGSGIDVTTIKGSISTKVDDSTSAIVSGADNATLSLLSVENLGGDDFSLGIYNSSSSFTISQVSTHGSGGTIVNVGVFNDSSSSTMLNVTANASGGNSNYGVLNYISSPTMTNITASAIGGTSIGIFNNTSSSPTMTNVTARASEGTENYGVLNLYTSSPTIRHSKLQGDDYSVYVHSGTTRIMQSSLIGPATANEMNGISVTPGGS